MALFYLVRHGTNDLLPKALAARLPHVHLNEAGREEARRVALVLERKGIQRLVSSPMERARETAEPLAQQLQLPVEISPDVNEIDFGGWSGKTMQELSLMKEWALFNSYRSGTRIPGGETMLEAQARVVHRLEKLGREQPNGTFAVFSHGDPIKAALAYFLGVPLDLFTRIEISTGSYSALRLEDWGPQVLAVNVKPE